MSLLTLSEVSAFYGDSQALFDVSLTLEQGQILALMGRNGMGKSTTIKTICRLLPHASGAIRFAGNDITRLPSHRVARLGIGLVPEGRRCFRNLSVHENLIAAARSGDWTLDKVTALFPRLHERLGQSAASLSGGEQQMLAIARALMTNPRLLILDEATEGLAPLVRQEIWSVVAQLKGASGLSILLVDKTLKELSVVADAAVVMERGSTVWADTMDRMTAEVVAQYLGV